jgi:hypothetical protein
VLRDRATGWGWLHGEGGSLCEYPTPHDKTVGMGYPICRLPAFLIAGYGLVGVSGASPGQPPHHEKDVGRSTVLIAAGVDEVLAGRRDCSGL